MTIPFFSRDAGRSLVIRKVTDATLQILGYLITKEIYFECRTLVYQAVHYVEQFPVPIEQSQEGFTLNLVCAQAASLENVRLDQQARSHVLGLNVVNLQLLLHEVFHVHS